MLIEKPIMSWISVNLCVCLLLALTCRFPAIVCQENGGVFSVEGPNNATVLVDRNVTLSCTVTGSIQNFNSTIEWQRNLSRTWSSGPGRWQSINRRGDSRLRMFISSNVTTSILTFTRVLRSDAGQYRCFVAISRHNRKLSKSGHLAVQAKAEIVGKMSNMTVQYGQEVVLSCEVVGFPIPYIHWTRNGLTVIDPRTEMTFSQKQLTFIAKENASYSCFAENTHIEGSTVVSSTAFVQVIDGSCSVYSGNVCQFAHNNSAVYVKSSIGIAPGEELVKNVKLWCSTAQCCAAAQLVLCSHAFPPCRSPLVSSAFQPQPVCRESCELVRDQYCASELAGVGTSQFLDCTILPAMNGSAENRCLYPDIVAVVEHQLSPMLAINSSSPQAAGFTMFELAFVVSIAGAVTLTLLIFGVVYSHRKFRHDRCGRRRRRTNSLRQLHDCGNSINVDLLPSNNSYVHSPLAATTRLVDWIEDDGGSGAVDLDLMARFEYDDHRNDIVYVDDIAPCAFGRVFRANVPCRNDVGNGVDETAEMRRTTVAVKMLNEDADQTTCSEFLRNVSLLALLQHRNVIQLFGVCLERTPFCIILEYMDSGDLCEYLRLQDPVVQLNSRDGGGRTSPLTVMSRIGIAIQIATAMAFVSSRNYVHRDVTTMNFLVSSSADGDSEPIVKLSDFMLARQMTDGLCILQDDAEHLPLRWMAPEAISSGQFSVASDVWSFGVTLWEVFSHARQPYSWLPNKNIRDSICGGSVLAKPKDAPDSVYSVMQCCWARCPADRPSFDTLLKLLEQLYTSLC